MESGASSAGCGPGDLSTLVAEIEPLLAPFLSRQEWCTGTVERVAVEDVESLSSGLPALVALRVRTAGVAYQVLVGVRAGDNGADTSEQAFLAEQPECIIGRVGLPDAPLLTYDALADPELVGALVDIVTGQAQGTEHMRKGRCTQRGTSLLLDDRFELRVFRRVVDGANPEVEMILALDGEGFNHVPAPVAVWRRGGFDLAIVLELLTGATDGTALARTSLRDLYASGVAPGATGGDFSGEAERLGNMTGFLHIALASAFGTKTDQGGAVATRIHGDYDLDHVSRAEMGWFVHDFEPRAPDAAGDLGRRAPVVEDIGTMFASLRAAARAVAHEWSPSDPEALAGLADSWIERNEKAFVDGYLAATGVESVAAEEAVRGLVET